MFGNEYQANTPLTAVTAVVGAGATTVSTTGTFYYKVNGKAYGAVSAADLAALTGFTITAGYGCIFTYYIRFNNTASGNTHILEVEKSVEKQLNTWDAASSTWTPNVLGFLADFDTLSDNTNPSSASITATDTDISRAVVCRAIVLNAAVTQFVGGTTALDAASVTTIIVPVPAGLSA